MGTIVAWVISKTWPYILIVILAFGAYEGWKWYAAAKAENAQLEQVNKENAQAVKDQQVEQALKGAITAQERQREKDRENALRNKQSQVLPSENDIAGPFWDALGDLLRSDH